MKNRKGFTLLEVIGVVAVLALVIAIALPVFGNIKNNTLKREFQNVKSRIELAAEQYASDTKVITVSVGKLIEEGYLSADDQETIYDPITNESLNCNIVELTFNNGTYSANLTDNNVTGADGTCNSYEGSSNSIIKIACYDENGNTTACEKTFEDTNSWYSGSVKLTYEGSDNVTNYRWSALTGESSTEDHIIVTTDSIKSTVFTLSVTYEDGNVSTGNVVVQIDNQNPVVVDVVKDDGWSKGTKAVTINASDYSGSGIAGYAISNSNDCTSAKYQENSAFNLNTGTYYACVKDKAGNISSSHEFEVKNIDAVKPSVLTENGANFTTYSETKGITYYSELTRKVSFTDTESGIAQIKYCFTSSNTCTPDKDATIKTGSTSEALLTYVGNKEATKVCAMAIDSVGNESSVICDNTFLVDTTAPSSVIATHNATNSSLVNVSATDAESGINKIVCKYGTSSSNLSNEVTASNGVCDLGRISSGVKYYVKVIATNNANLTSSKDLDFTANVSISDAYTEICKGNEYCNDKLYVKYNNNLFVVYRRNNGYKAIYNGVYTNYNYLQNGCCNNGHCTYSGANYSNTILSSYLNSTFLNNLPNYANKINYGIWYTGNAGSVTSRSVSAYVGLMDYNEYLNTKSKSWIYSGANGAYFWLLTPYDTSSYINNYIVRYNNGTFSESSQVVNSSSGVRPVIVLKDGITFVSGNGTYENPYVV